MDIEIRKTWEKVPDALRPVFFLMGVLLVLVGGYVSLGVQTVDAEGTCYSKTVTCHGFITPGEGDGCMGWKRTNMDYVEKNSCQSLDQIKKLCGKVKKAVCQQETSEWMDEGVVFSRTCQEWNSVYDLGMTSCKQ
jgi:hypothetical protein